MVALTRWRWSGDGVQLQQRRSGGRPAADSRPRRAAAPRRSPARLRAPRRRRRARRGDGRPARARRHRPAACAWRILIVDGERVGDVSADASTGTGSRLHAYPTRASPAPAARRTPAAELAMRAPFAYRRARPLVGARRASLARLDRRDDQTVAASGASRHHGRRWRRSSLRAEGNGQLQRRGGRRRRSTGRAAGNYRSGTGDGQRRGRRRRARTRCARRSTSSTRGALTEHSRRRGAIRPRSAPFCRSRACRT